MTRYTGGRRTQRDEHSKQTDHVRADKQVAMAWALLLAGVTATVMVTPAVAFVVTLVPFLGLMAVSGDVRASRSGDHLDD